jgi:ribosome-binding factor A
MSNKNRRNPARRAPRESSVVEVEAQGDVERSTRGVRLEHLLLIELQSLIRDEVADPGLRGIVLIAVELSVDAGHARVAYAVTAAIDQEREVRRRSEAGLSRATGFLRARLASQLELKRLPRLTFRFVGVSQEDGPGGAR